MIKEDDVTTDHYQVLQIEPTAGQQEIEAAYRRLAEQYDPARLADMAAEIRDIAARRRAAIDTAYATLSDPERRTAYDAGIAAAQPASAQEPEDEEIIDYRPLPGPGRTSAPEVRPIRVTRQQPAGPGWRRWLIPALIVTGLASLVLALTWVLTEEGRNAPKLTVEEMRAIANSQNLIPPELEAAISDETLLDLLRQQVVVIAQLQSQAQATGNYDDWVNLGNATFDFLELIREQDQQGQGYQAVAHRWLEAANAYDQALQQRPSEGLVRSDLAVSMLRLYETSQDQEHLRLALDSARQALQDDPQGLRTMVNAGMVLLASPDSSEQGRQLLQTVVERSPQSREAQTAGKLLQGEMR